MAPRRSVAPRVVALLLCGLIGLGGCRATGQAASDYYAWGAGTFAQNPVTLVPFFGGLVIGALVGAPLSLISWPLTAIFYPEDDDEFRVQAAFAPSVFLGTTVGTLVSAPLYPLGIPFMPGAPEAHPGPHPAPPPSEPGLAQPPEDERGEGAPQGATRGDAAPPRAPAGER